MIFFKKSAKHKLKSYIYFVNQILRKKSRKEWNQECKQKLYPLFNFCNIFDLLNSENIMVNPRFDTWFLHIFLSRITQGNSKKFHQQVFAVPYLLNSICQLAIFHLNLVRKCKVTARYEWIFQSCASCTSKIKSYK